MLLFTTIDNANFEFKSSKEKSVIVRYELRDLKAGKREVGVGGALRS